MSFGISILYPNYEGVTYKDLPEMVCHDLALDNLCKKISEKEIEQSMIMRVISKVTDDSRVARFRSDVFDDIYRLPKLRDEMLKLLEEVQFLKDFGSFKRDYDKKATVWDLLHRLEEINDYIICVEKIMKCLENADIKSEGLKNLKTYVDSIYYDSSFDQMKKDISALKASTTSIKSITLGINLDERFETEGVGIISVNDKHFRNSGIVSNFAKNIISKDKISDETNWDGTMHYQPVQEDDELSLDKFTRFGALMQAQKGGLNGLVATKTVISMPEKDGTQEFSHYLSKTCDQMLSTTVKRLREVLSLYTSISINIMTDLIPEFIYYIRFAEFVEKKIKQGYLFGKANSIEKDLNNQSGQKSMEAKNFYNIKLVLSDVAPVDIVKNDLDFSEEHTLYVLTGANRGGKTTITQAVGQLYVLAQGGIYIPGESFDYVPVDCIFTHFPADEDKTLDLGRLGEECTRFKTIFNEATEKSLILMNETFSTTSFEEGYYIAKDSVKALLNKKVRTIYNTHMHKLARDIDEINETEGCKAASLIVEVKNNDRSFKVAVAPPEGMSYAKDIAEKYGVTFEILTKKYL